MSVGKVVYVSILAWKHKKISVLIWPPFRIFIINPSNAKLSFWASAQQLMLQTYIISLHRSKSKFILVFSSAQLQLRSLLPRATLFSLIQLTILFLSSPTIIIIIPSTCPYLSSSNCHTLNSLSHTQKGASSYHFMRVCPCVCDWA